MSATQAPVSPHRSIRDRAGDMASAAMPSRLGAPGTTRAAISGPIMRVGQGILVAVIVLILLGELYSTDIVANPDNANVFTNLTGTFGDYGEVAFIMIGLGLIALGASVALSYFGGFGGNGDR